MIDEAIAVVGYGCVLPGAGNSQEFWQLLLKGQPQFRSISRTRWGGLDSPEKVDSDLAAFVDESLFVDEKSPLPRLHQMVKKALDEATRMTPPTLFLKNRKVGVFLGCMSAEDAAAVSYLRARKQTLLQQIRRNGYVSSELLSSIEQAFQKCFGEAEDEADLQRAFTNSLAAWIHQKLNTRGPALCLDSACASSLSALDVAIQYLRSGLIDIAVTGGVEGNLGLESFVPFSKLGVLSRGKSLPFDSRTDGIIQGEGAVMFVLQRLADALKGASSVTGIIQGIKASSNGAKASLFSPSFEEQTKLTKANNNEHGTEGLIYIEGHGTGTPVGDVAELKALEQSFSEIKERIYLGSVKSLIGHTKGAAGAAGLLKCLLIMKHQVLPPSPYFESFPQEISGEVVKINKTPIPFCSRFGNQVQMRVNSSGFGGANYQLVLFRYNPKSAPLGFSRKMETEIVVSGFSEVSYLSAKNEIHRYKWKIPPNQLTQLDVSQIAGLVAVKTAFERSLIPVSALNPDRTAVIYAAVTRTKDMEEILECLGLRRLALAPELNGMAREKILQMSRKKHVFTENSCQAICSMTSGRIAQEFNLTGINFHLDADFSSPGYALQQASLMLRASLADTVIILANREGAPGHPILLERELMQAWVVSTKEISETQDYPVLGTISGIEMSHD